MRNTDRLDYLYEGRKKVSFFFLLFVIMAGVIAGTVLVCVKNGWEGLRSIYANQNLYKPDNLPLAVVFARSALPVCAMLLAMFISGFCAFGQPVQMLFTAYRGFAVGVSSALIYLELGIKGFPAVLLMILPFAAVSSLIVIIGSREAMSFSGCFADFAFGRKTNEICRPDVRLYGIKFIILIAAALISAGADSVITYFLSGILL